MLYNRSCKRLIKVSALLRIFFITSYSPLVILQFRYRSLKPVFCVKSGSFFILKRTTPRTVLVQGAFLYSFLYSLLFNSLKPLAQSMPLDERIQGKPLVPSDRLQYDRSFCKPRWRRRLLRIQGRFQG